MKGGQLHRGQPGRDRPDDAGPARAEGRHGDGGEQHSPGITPLCYPGPGKPGPIPARS